MAGTAAQPDSAGPYLFISYASVDRERVGEIADALRARGIAVWLDQQGIAGGANYGAEIAEGIERCAAFVLMCTAASLASRNVRQEIALAWKFERPYLPLLIEPVAIPREVAYWLETAQWIELFDKPDADWLPAVLTALEPFGVTSATETQAALAGREREQAILREHLTNAANGQGSLVLIGGEAGIGKTTLAEAICREAGQRGALVLTGRCFDLAETPPYGPWLYLFARYRPSGDLPPLPDAFAQRGVIGEIASQMALFIAVQDFLAAVGERQPLVLLLDDSHWADPASLDLLRFLAQSVATLPLLLIATYRVDELTRRHPLYALLPTLVREADALRLDLRRLDADAVRAVVAARYPLDAADTARLVAYLHERTEGNPFFLGELLRTLEEEGVLRATEESWTLGDLTRARVPALLRQVIDGRLARLGEEAQQALAIAAVIGQEVPFDLWATIVGDDEETLLGVVEQATEARVVEATPSGAAFRFVHALIRETLYEGILPLRRRVQHRTIAETLAALPKPDPDMVAYHFQQGGDARAAEWLVAAGERAERAYAYLTAAERFEAALALLEGQDTDPGQQGWLLLRLALLRRFSDAQRGIAYLEAAASFVAASNDPPLAAYITLIGGLMRCYAGDIARGIEGLEAGVRAIGALTPDQLPPSLPPSLAAALERNTSGIGLLLVWLALAGRYAEARRLGEPLIEGEGSGTPGGTAVRQTQGDVFNGLSFVYSALGLPRQARAANERARQDYDAIGNLNLVGLAIQQEMYSVWLPYFSDEIAARHRLEDAAEVAFERATSVRGQRDRRFAHISSLTLEGEWQSVRELFQAAGPGSAAWMRWRGLHRACLGTIAHWQGDAEVAWAIVVEYLPDGTRTEPGDSSFLQAIACIRLAAELALESGDLVQAEAWIAMHDRWLAWSGAALGQSEGQALWAAYHRAAGDPTTAYQHAERALAHATDPRQPLALLAAHRLRGALDTDAGRYDDAEHHLTAALALADACAAPFERALTLLATAELRAATGNSDAARTLLGEVRTICTPLDAKPTLARADAIAACLDG